MGIVRWSHVQHCCRPLSPEATAGPMSGPWTRGKVWPAYSTAFDWCVPRAHWPAGGRARTATFLRQRFCKPGGFKAPPLVGVQANGSAESRKLAANQYVGNFRGRLGARWIRLSPF
ncbi:hypothetical protein T07_8321 [Trichinella nelsoni]|uniref:Uncharacterized protein n=1 Tax=Trichinella nelsoni TaxID=6336 RepID=A0A0V0RD72_9BILA|nr:hypothetical protein T07_8321 [Trichinella nelsoni]